jgi:hypothetical protein
MLTPREEIAELDALILAHKANISHVRHLLNDPEGAARHVTDTRRSIQKLLERIAEIESVQLHGWEMIDRSKSRLVELRNKRAAVVNAAGIEKLIALAEEMNALKENGDGGLDIAAIVEEIDNELEAEENDDNS